jgi:hypothetical protein
MEVDEQLRDDVAHWPVAVHNERTALKQRANAQDDEIRLLPDKVAALEWRS